MSIMTASSWWPTALSSPTQTIRNGMDFGASRTGSLCQRVNTRCAAECCWSSSRAELQCFFALTFFLANTIYFISFVYNFKITEGLRTFQMAPQTEVTILCCPCTNSRGTGSWFCREVSSFPVKSHGSESL